MDKQNIVEPSGLLILHKPVGITSHDAVYKIRRLYATKRVGHTGTLDPLAEGVLVMLVGRAAKAAEYLVSDTKEYIATLYADAKGADCDTNPHAYEVRQGRVDAKSTIKIWMAHGGGFAISIREKSDADGKIGKLK